MLNNKQECWNHRSISCNGNSVFHRFKLFSGVKAELKPPLVSRILKAALSAVRILGCGAANFQSEPSTEFLQRS